MFSLTNYSEINESTTKQWHSKEIINCQAWHPTWIIKACSRINNNNSPRFCLSLTRQADLAVRRGISDLIQVLSNSDNRHPATLIITIRTSNNNNHNKVRLVIKHSQISTFNLYQQKATVLALLNSNLTPLISQKIIRVSQITWHMTKVMLHYRVTAPTLVLV